MSRARFSAVTFSMSFCCAYVLVFGLNWPLFLYHPLHGEFTWGPKASGVPGPAMAWYGLMASAAGIALVATIIMPRGLVERVLRNYLWVLPCLTMLVCIFLLRNFFR